MGITGADFDYVRRLVRDRSAIVLEVGKEYLVESRLLPLVREEGFANLQDMVSHLRGGPPRPLHRRVVELMTTNETWFFRDLRPFEVLRSSILPELLTRRSDERRLHIWSAACSSGQEPYTMAMIISEHFPQLASWNVRIIATDLSTEILDRARAGRYSQLEVNRGMPAALLVKYFRKVGNEWHISDAIRRQVEFRELNLVEAWPVLPLMDLVFLRNVLIYFDVETKKSIFGRVRRLLRPDGYLMLGGAETTLNIDDAFERTAFDRAGAYQLRTSPQPVPVPS